MPKGACAGRVATIVGRPGADRLRGTRKADVIVAGPGNDRIDAVGGADLVCAGPGNDVVNGGPGNDVAYGGPGNDTIFSRDGDRDTLDCGPGYDTAIVDTIERTRHCEIVTKPPK